MSVFVNNPGTSRISGVSSKGKRFSVPALHLGNKKVAQKYIKIIYVELEKRDGKFRLGIISHVKNMESNIKSAHTGKKFVAFPIDVDSLKQLQEKYYISQELEATIIRQM